MAKSLGSSARLQLPSYAKMDEWGGVVGMPTVQAPSAFNSGNFNLTGSNTPAPVNLNNFGLNQEPVAGLNINGSSAPGGMPAAAGNGGWMDKNGKGGMALGVAQVGLGVYNAMEQAKMNKFMRGYYGDQMAMQKTDFSNAAKSTNEALSARQGRILSAQGTTTGTAANQAGVNDYMKQWGVNEKF